MAAGRPRTFDADTALARALAVFWQKGYEGASLPDLTAAMGINRPSLYAAFGNKESLFRKAVDAYVRDATAAMQDALDAPTAREGIANLLHLVIRNHSCGETPRGCLLVQGALACGAGAETVKQELATRRAESESLIRQRLERAIPSGEIASPEEAAALASFYTTIIQGMSVQSSGGACIDKMKPIVEAALRAFPS